jgi:hypothetical protein
MTDVIVLVVGGFALLSSIGFVWGFYIGRRHGAKDAMGDLKLAIIEAAQRDSEALAWKGSWHGSSFHFDAKPDEYYRTMLLEADAIMKKATA